MNGKLHRDGGLPAVEHNNGFKSWWINGKRHRDGGLPAVENANGTKEWWINGEKIHSIQWVEFPKPTDWVGKMCLISLETIQNDSEVCECNVCSANMLFQLLSEWLKIRETCPHYRSPWTNFIRFLKKNIFKIFKKYINYS